MRIPINQLRLDWRYFLHAWRVPAETPEAEELLADARRIVDSIAGDPDFDLRAEVLILPARGDSEAEQIIIGDQTFSAPRQKPGQGNGRQLSLADFVSPSGDRVGVFAVTVADSFIRRLEQLKADSDYYESMMWQLIGDRLAEAGAQWLHEATGKEIGTEGIRPAIGYPSMPDHSQIFILNKLLPLSELGISLTETGAMYPQASIAGLMIFNPRACYFDAR